MADIVDLDQYRRARTPTPAPAQTRSARPEPMDVPDEPGLDPVDFGWLVIESDAKGHATRWFHPRWIAQLGQLAEAPEWVFLDHRGEVRAWRTIDAGAVAFAMDRGAVPDPDLTLPWKQR